MGEWSDTVIKNRTAAAERRLARQEDKLALQRTEIRERTQERIRDRLPKDRSDIPAVEHAIAQSVDSLVDGGAAETYRIRRAELQDELNQLSKIETEARERLSRRRLSAMDTLAAENRAARARTEFKRRGFDTRAPSVSGYRFGPWALLPVVVFIESIFAFPVVKNAILDNSTDAFFQTNATYLAIVAVTVFAGAGAFCFIRSAEKYKQHRANQVMNEIATEYENDTKDEGDERLNLRVEENLAHLFWIFGALVFQIVLFGFRLLEQSDGFGSDRAVQLFSLLATLLPLALALYEYHVAPITLHLENFDKAIIDDYLALKVEALKNVPLERLRLKREDIQLRQSVIEELNVAAPGLFSTEAEIDSGTADILSRGLMSAVTSKKETLKKEIEDAWESETILASLDVHVDSNEVHSAVGSEA